MPRVTVCLTQHTPLLHFQADETGATIRGTELKPALDRYLQAVAKDTLAGFALPNPNPKEAKTAYRYRVTVVAGGTTIIPYNDHRLKYSPFFVMDDDEGSVPHNAVMQQNVTVTFLTPYQEVRDEIKAHVARFFLANNFGFRKGKGFGSYTVRSIDGVPVSLNVEEELSGFVREYPGYEHVLYRMNAGGGDWVNVMNVIAAVSSEMKSGRNLTNPRINLGYHRSILMKEYAYKKNGAKYSNEKRCIKIHLSSVRRRYHAYDVNNKDGSRRKEDWIGEYPLADEFRGDSPYEYRFVRAMLGLADHYNFGIKDITVNIKDTKNEIARFANPIVFKPIQTENGWQVYLMLRKIPDVMYGRTFTFSVKGRNDTPVEIMTPTTEEFSLTAFMEFVAAYGFKSPGTGKIEKVPVRGGEAQP